MPVEDPEQILAMLRDPNVGSQEVADETGLPRTEAARAARLLVGLAKATPEEVATLPPPLQAALLKAALDGDRVEVLAVLAASSDKVLSKEAKRCLHLLRSRGVAVPEAPRAAPPPPSPVAEEVFPCYGSSIDSQGERAIWISRNVPGRGVEVGQAVISDVNGLIELQVGVLGRKEYRTFGRDIAERGQTMGVGEIDPGHARGLVAQARRQNDTSGRSVPEGADAWLARIGPGTLPPDPTETLPPLPEEAERAALEASADLHSLPMLRGWIADEASLRALATTLDGLQASKVLADEGQRTERMAAAVAEALEAWLDPACRQRLSSRLFAVAFHFQGTGLADRAAQAAAAARALAAGSPGSAIPFARRMVEKAFPAGGSGSPAAPATPVISAPRR
jgi:hypothetical protein